VERIRPLAASGRLGDEASAMMIGNSMMDAASPLQFKAGGRRFSFQDPFAEAPSRAVHGLSGSLENVKKNAGEAPAFFKKP
jgi:hypothetical protein